MSRKQKLSKKIAHTILAMSIVYSGGMNVLCNTAFAPMVLMEMIVYKLA